METLFRRNQIPIQSMEQPSEFAMVHDEIGFQLTTSMLDAISI